MREWAKFFPAIFFFLVWLSLISAGSSMKEAINQPLNSDSFITTFGQAIDNPWTHNSAIRLYFKKLLKDEAAPRIWTASRPYGWALWHQYQYDGSVEIMMGIAHQSNNIWEERKWAERYATTHPGRARAGYYFQHVRYGHAQHKPLELLGQW